MSRIVGSSLKRLNTCHKHLQIVIHEASDIMDLTVLCGARSKEEQNKAYSEGKSKLKWPNSKHNAQDGISLAVDVIPYFQNEPHYDWNDLFSFARLAGVIFAVAHRHGIKLRWGGDWNGDGRSKDQRFNDLVHFELVE